MLYSLVGRRLEDVPAGVVMSGVSRFDAELRKVFPQMRSVTPAGLPHFTPQDVVIADNHLSLLVPETTPCIVVHHGCARTHYDRDPKWRSPATAKMCQDQADMFHVKHRIFVAPSRWVRAEFASWHDLPADYARVILHWVPVISHQVRNGGPPTILGDWRDENKGVGLWRGLAAELPQYRFQKLACKSDAERIAAYRQADAYLCLSLSEGGAYATLDAEAAGLPVITTPTGMAMDFSWWHTLPFVQDRTDARLIASTIAKALRAPRPASIYDRYTFESWATLWRAAVDDVRDA